MTSAAITFTCAWRSPSTESLEICGEQVASPARPMSRCPKGHDLSWWVTGPVWRCNATTKYGSCGALATSLLPKCPEGHLSSWVVDVPAPIAETTPDVLTSSPLSAPVSLVRRRLSGERSGTTRTFRLHYKHRDGTPDVMHLYFTANTYEGGGLGEVFIKADRMGALAHGALDATATMISLMLQYGVPVEVVIAKLRYTRYDPSGFTGDPEFPSCTSPLDLLAQWLDRRFGVKP